ncbi:MAG: VTT domain-containing protein [Thermoproteota archaeon]|nr:VTT domain-containing protein [Candidatus Brockarchaeota archaeon]
MKRIFFITIGELVKVVESLGYAGAFIAGFLGTSSIFLSIFPSFLVIMALGTKLNPLLVGILGGIGSGIGQFTHYYIGYAGRYVVSESRKKQFDEFGKKLNKYGVLLIFLFAATPLTPDDLVWIPLGAMNYPKLKALLAAIAGKIILNLVYAYSGYYGIKLLLRWLGT